MVVALPEDLADFAWIAQSDRPLIVCDVDEVVLAFITPFMRFLNSRGYELRPTSFRLAGNIFSTRDGTQPDREAVAGLIESFFIDQEAWQTPVEAAAEALAELATDADIVFLTAMPPRHFKIRRRLLDRHGLHYPMIATEGAKGAILQLIHGERTTKVVFIDDIFTNLHSVRDHLPNTLLVNLVANPEFRAMAPHPGEAVVRPADWRQAAVAIRSFLDDQESPPLRQP